jgi:hypothetical protein
VRPAEREASSSSGRRPPSGGARARASPSGPDAQRALQLRVTHPGSTIRSTPLAAAVAQAWRTAERSCRRGRRRRSLASEAGDLPGGGRGEDGERRSAANRPSPPRRPRRALPPVSAPDPSAGRCRVSSCLDVARGVRVSG